MSGKRLVLAMVASMVAMSGGLLAPDDDPRPPTAGRDGPPPPKRQAPRPGTAQLLPPASNLSLSWKPELSAKDTEALAAAAEERRRKLEKREQRAIRAAAGRAS